MSTRPLIIAPSILASDFSRLRDEILRAEQGGADWLHLDVMDGHFVDNISFGPPVVDAIAAAATKPLDVHLMISRPDHYFPRFVKSGAMGITVHVEADHKIAKTLAGIRAAGCKAGLALNPPTSFSAVEPFLDQIDLLLVMTVHPGFGGQSFIPETLEKIRTAAKIREDRGLDFHIEVDGGIQRETAAESVAAGANVLVAGTSIFGADDAAAAIMGMRG